MQKHLLFVKVKRLASVCIKLVNMLVVCDCLEQTVFRIRIAKSGLWSTTLRWVAARHRIVVEYLKRYISNYIFLRFGHWQDVTERCIPRTFK